MGGSSMIDAIRGQLADIGPDYVCLETHGITYQIYCPAETLRACRDQAVESLYTHLVVREDVVQLYGFVTTEARELFRKLLTVAQVGPKLALQILSSMPVETLIEAIRTNDVSRLTSIKGIGEKTAQRILIDLRDKLSTGSLEALRAVLLSPAEETVLQALTSKSLGFSAREARQAILELRGRRLDSQELLREALALIGRGR